MQSLVTSLLACLTASPVFCSPAAAAPPTVNRTAETSLTSLRTDQLTVRQSSDSTITSSVTDAMFDYDLYIADPESASGFFIEWTYEDGEVIHTGPHVSEDSAHDWLVWCLFHGVDPRDSISDPDLSWPNTAIVELPTEPDWILFGSYGTRAEAEVDAAWFEDFGMPTRIVSRSVLTLQADGLTLQKR